MNDKKVASALNIIAGIVLGLFVVTMIGLLIFCAPPSKPVDNTTNDLRQINQELKDINARMKVIEKKVEDMKARGEL